MNMTVKFHQLPDRQEEAKEKKRGGGRHRASKKKLSSERRKSLKRLEMAEKRIKEQERQYRLKSMAMKILIS